MMKVRQKKQANGVSITQETYIETIAELLSLKGRARIRDIAGNLGVSTPSASEVVASLRRKGIVSGRPWHEIQLTDAGRRVALRLARRQAALARFMVEVMAMSAREADATACRIEHHVDRRFATRLLKLVQFLERQNPAALKAFAAQSSRNVRVREGAGE